MIPARLERATHSLEGCCSIQLSYGTIQITKIVIFSFRNIDTIVKARFVANTPKDALMRLLPDRASLDSTVPVSSYSVSEIVQYKELVQISFIREMYLLTTASAYALPLEADAFRG